MLTAPGQKYPSPIFICSVNGIYTETFSEPSIPAISQRRAEILPISKKKPISDLASKLPNVRSNLSSKLQLQFAIFKFKTKIKHNFQKNLRKKRKKKKISQSKNLIQSLVDIKHRRNFYFYSTSRIRADFLRWADRRWKFPIAGLPRPRPIILSRCPIIRPCICRPVSSFIFLEHCVHG